MAVGLNKKEIDGPASQRAVACDLEPALPPIGARVTLNYPGKMDESIILQKKDTKYLRVGSDFAKESSLILPNSFIWSDNSLALNRLMVEGKKAKLIYLDPPYATGMGFSSRSNEHAYDDCLTEAAYLEFMRRRLILMREILDDDGTIYVHIGHQMLGELKCLLDEIFGRERFINLITRRKCSSKNSTKNNFANLNDYILCYSKGKKYIWNRPLKKPDAEWLAKEYPKTDSKGQFKLVPIHAPGVRHGATGGEWKGMLPPPGKHWQYTPEKLDILDASGDIHWSKTGNPRRKVYLTDDKSIGYTDYWEEFRDAHHQSILVTGYPTEKNFNMMKLIVGASSNPGDLVIDPFCGSGSTLHAASLLQRKWIGIDESLFAAKTVMKRFAIGRAPMGDYVNTSLNKQTELPLSLNETARHEYVSNDFNIYVDELTASVSKNELAEIQKAYRDLKANQQ
ncbi:MULTISPECIES: site-specific DNA-methyltransferase [Enterobacteriaceae]|uniref:Type II methyltransferase M.EcaI n=3 Tax=Enterobacteriaceae TaxID=543 RepID=MTEC_ENTCL|nr:MULTISPECIES: site-specific DNA-methyltransferase [Enterobacteriaceae]P14827.1 RecName: Full=Type II methyltransferase M.EcaI; Short=M.EcaI; AltName: Full=Adenine-specific methyltransferase EcaI; AltName: Full=Modification methylase EcaI [Enterobacter cloacae]EFO7855686.1 site-specific DNA-methyltransferase [Salmonella enterica]HCB1581689.1 site-specific DNA-methyltransferase [Citrobacter braakii]HDW2027573.1 site-specific DNA-methyltransferase [Enterobacter ludwigii]HDZ0557066.1 site-speci